MSEQWVITGVQIVGTGVLHSEPHEPMLVQHEEEVNTAIETINSNPDGVGVVIGVSGPSIHTIRGGTIWSASSITTAITFGVPASTYALLPGMRAKYRREDFT